MKLKVKESKWTYSLDGRKFCFRLNITQVPQPVKVVHVIKILMGRVYTNTKKESCVICKISWKGCQKHLKDIFSL